MAGGYETNSDMFSSVGGDNHCVSPELSRRKRLSLELRGMNYTSHPPVASEGRSRSSTGCTCSYCLRWGTVPSAVPSAFAAVIPFFTTSLSQESAGHSTVIERVAVII